MENITLEEAIKIRDEIEENTFRNVEKELTNAVKRIEQVIEDLIDCLAKKGTSRETLEAIFCRSKLEIARSLTNSINRKLEESMTS